MAFYTYIVCNRRNGTLYTGHTDDLMRRCWEHQNRIRPGFASKYHCTRLVWFEEHDTRESAFTRERRIKDWRRQWKLNLIEKANPDWRDLYLELLDWTPTPTFHNTAHPGEGRGPAPHRPD
ncbi:GIY-YIG nuclease family protein [Hyphomonas atlantica corrig.]|uniref:GIY-YIG nuclease family protein n=1 Tax=Hyphomonas atlantica TaxID=1280948 RepID=UPI00235502B6|nr:GIY-YIG nuclease family protein [Hyphomonas atlantica]|tara:strand:- start:2066 stop:2428 length:363 start_codon:yes stop_codon:yes gene_type:complete